MVGEPLHSQATGPFRICGSCEKQWASWEDFVLDPEVRLLGLQVVPMVPDANLLVFNHSCGTSISLFTKLIHPLMPNLEGEAERSILIDYDECRKHCQKVEDLADCNRPCFKARDRRLVQLILQLKQGAG